MPALEGEQILALNKLKAWWNDKEAPQYFTLVGAAGTGKSYTLTAFMEELHLDYNRVIFGTLAGKAALVLRQRGILTATTIHKLIYIPFEAINVKTKEPCIRFAKRATLPDTVELIVVDECSMIDDKIIADLLSYGKRVIFVGDKFQLKPITGVNKLMNNTPDAELTTPRRQALDNSILQVATDIRNGKMITQYGMIGNNVLRVDMDYMKKNMVNMLLI
jgi:exodeoxyribonuclease-5